MIAAIVKFELKDEVKRQLADVLDICRGEPRIEVYMHTASLTGGVLL